MPMTVPEPLGTRAIVPRTDVLEPRISHVFFPSKIMSIHGWRIKRARIKAILQRPAYYVSRFLLNFIREPKIMADDNDIHRIPTRDIRQEDGAHELATSPDMKPYLNFIKAVMQDHDPSLELEAIRQLPLEERYVWRVASALKRGLADCDDLSVQADRQTLRPEDFKAVMDLLKFRPMQLAIVLKALVGAEEMQRMMIEAIGMAKQQE
jgi:hypothetical protein